MNDEVFNQNIDDLVYNQNFDSIVVRTYTFNADNEYTGENVMVMSLFPIDLIIAVLISITLITIALWRHRQ